MLMVIFGAGSSFDSSPDFPPPATGGGSQNFGPSQIARHSRELWRPPLANGLFRDPGAYGDIVRRYPKLLPILPHLRQPLRGRSVEEELESFQDQANGDVERRRQLFSARYYLQELLFNISQEWLKETSSVTNFVTLLDQIRHLNAGSEPILLVNFNYDLLLDRALLSFGYSPRPLEQHFDAHPILKLFKPHGSADWARFVDAIPNTRLTPQQIIEQAEAINLSDDYILANATDPRQIFSFGRPILPAIAIPAQTKTEDTFEWPKSHRDYLEELLPGVTKILIIGWQAREAHFSQILRHSLPRRGLTHIMVVDRNSDDANKVLRYFSGEIGQMPAKHAVGNGGFSDFVVQRDQEFFFKV